MVLYHALAAAMFAIGLAFGHWLMSAAAFVCGFVVDFIIMPHAVPRLNKPASPNVA